MRDGGLPADDEAVSPLLEAVSIDALIGISRGWSEVDRRHTAQLAALDDSASQLRSTLRAAGAQPVERLGAQAPDADAAIKALGRANASFRQATQNEARAEAELAAADQDAAIALRECGDVLMARRVIAALVVLFFLVIVRMLFRG